MKRKAGKKRKRKTSHSGSASIEVRVSPNGGFFLCEISDNWRPVKVCSHCKKKCRIRGQMLNFWSGYNEFPIRRQKAPPTRVEPSGKEYNRARERATTYGDYDYLWPEAPSGGVAATQIETESEKPKKIDPRPMKIQLDSYEEE